MSTFPGAPGVTVRVPAKVNLDLRVGPVRPDGFHALSTVYQAVNLYDTVTVRPRSDGDSVRIRVRGEYVDRVPTDDTNLAAQAALALARATGHEAAVEITIDKEIPVAGGMAGGSADAAAALVACDQLWGTGLSKDELSEIAASLGSDVPFLLTGGTALGSGRGELITPVLTSGRLCWVFVPSDGPGLSTPEVYQEFDRLHPKPERVGEPDPELLTALRKGDAHALAPLLRNDLQEAAVSLRPELGELLEQGTDYGALAAIVSGSGPTVAFLSESEEGAIDLAVALAASGLAPQIHRAQGPAHGASVLTN